MNELQPEHIEWSKKLFHTLNPNGGKWGVPRWGITFRREGGKLILFDRMPYTPEMSAAFSAGAEVPASPSELTEHQQSGIDLIVAHFRAAGIEVEDQTTKKGNVKS